MSNEIKKSLNKLFSSNNILYYDNSTESIYKKDSEFLKKFHSFSGSKQNKENINNNSSFIFWQDFPNSCQSYSSNFSNKLLDSLVGEENVKNKELSFFYLINSYNKSYSSGSQKHNIFDLPKISEKIFSNSKFKRCSSSSIKIIKSYKVNLRKSSNNISGFYNIPNNKKLNSDSINKLTPYNKHYSNNILSKFTIDSSKDANENLLIKNYFIEDLKKNKGFDDEMNNILMEVNNQSKKSVKVITKIKNNLFENSITNNNIDG